jgi:hypothetical protein
VERLRNFGRAFSGSVGAVNYVVNVGVGQQQRKHGPGVRGLNDLDGGPFLNMVRAGKLQSCAC